MEDSEHHVWCGGGSGCSNCFRINRDSNSESSYESKRTYRRFNRNSFRFNSIFLVFLIGLVSISISHYDRIRVSGEESSNNNNAAIISQSEVKTIEPTNNPSKVFVRRRIFRKLVKDTSGNNSSSASSEDAPAPSPQPSSQKPKTLFSLMKFKAEEAQQKQRSLAKQSSSTVTGNTLKSSMQSSQSLASKQKFNFQSLKTRLGLSVTTTTTTTAEPAAANSSLVMIPLPPNQRKPYTPVIMQVSKSTTPSPETKVQTFKLNKMFVPIGIYGKVVDNETSTADATPAKEPEATSTPIPSIRHKGSDSGNSAEKKSARKHKGIAESVDLTYARTDPKLISLTTEKPNIAGISITTESNDLFSSVFGKDYNNAGPSNGLRRGDNSYSKYKNRPFTGGSNGGLTLMTPPALGGQSDSASSSSSLLDNYGSYSTYGTYNKQKYSPSSIVDSITGSMSRIPSLVPSLFHKGLTSLASMTSSLKENPFVDENFPEANLGMNKAKPLISLPSSYKHKIPASVPGGYIQGLLGGGGSRNKERDQIHAGSEIKQINSKGSGSGGSLDLSEYETLEYFRKRPHLLAHLRQQHQQQGSSWRRSQGVRFSKGFKPATAPEAIAREYYKSTSTTTASTPEEELLKAYHNIRKAKKLRGSWLLRNSNEYVSNRNDKLVSMWRSLFDSFDDEEDPSSEPKSPPQSTISNRRSSSIPKSSRQNPLLSAKLASIKQKYSKDQINEAKERILTLINSGYGDELDHEEEAPLEDEHDLQLQYDTHMPPPLPDIDAPPHHHGHHHDHHHDHPLKSLSLTKGLSAAATGAFKDLVKFFKLGVSVGTGQAREPVNYEQIVDEQEEQELAAGSSDWKPVLRQPLISFSAGISLKNPSKPKLSHHHHHASPSHSHSHPHHHHVHSHHVEEVDLPPSSHYSSSSTPYIPPSYELGSAPTSPSYSTSSYEPSADEEVVEDYQDEPEIGHSTPPKTYATASSDDVYSYQKYQTLKLKQHQQPKAPVAAVENDMEHSNTDWSPVSSGGSRLRNQVLYSPGLGASSEYELVPSSVYLNGDHDPRDIAAVVKPAGVSDDLVRSTLPAGLRNLKILDYPHEYGSLNSISQQVLDGGSGVGGAQALESYQDQKISFKKAMKKLRDNYVAKESAYLPPATASLLQQQAAYLAQQQLEQPYLQHQQSLFSQPAYFVPQQQQLLPTSLFSTASRINAGGSNHYAGLGAASILDAAAAAGGSGKDPLGFTTNYNLPQNLDPDIAALLKSELDKDDIPEDIRQEFIDAKKEEEQKKLKQAQQQQQHHQQQQNRRVDIAQQDLIDSLLSTAAKRVNHQPPQQQQASSSIPMQNQFQVPSLQNVIQPSNFNSQIHPQQAQQPIQSRVYNPFSPPPRPPPLHAPMVTTKFFAPIPITPTLMTTALKNPRYASPVPRYVLELAKKLNTDKTVQGIVRVSAKRGRGLPPIEYLYPVKG